MSRIGPQQFFRLIEVEGEKCAAMVRGGFNEKLKAGKDFSEPKRTIEAVARRLSSDQYVGNLEATAEGVHRLQKQLCH